MTVVDDLGEVIASRSLCLKDDPNTEILVTMWKPRASERGDYSCSVQIKGIGDEKVRSVYGKDAFQAIQLAMAFIGQRLGDLNEQHLGKIWSEYGDNGTLGFPPWK